MIGDDEELLAELRRSLAGDAPRPPSPPAEPAESADIERPRERPVSTAAMAIADQIMGLEAAIATDAAGPTRSLVLRGPNGDSVTIDGIRIVGRRADADLTIGDGRVSRSHAEVRIEGGRHVVRDLGSSNGTYLVRDEVTQRVGSEPLELVVGDRLETIDRLLLAELVEDDG